MKLLVVLLFNFSLLCSQNKNVQIYKEYHENSPNIKISGFMSDKGQQGVWKWYSKEGIVIITGKYEDSRQVGIWKEFHDDGKKIFKIDNYVNGLREGLSKTFYDNGNLITEVNYSNGKKEGEVINYYKGGKIKGKLTYLHNKQVGPFSLYFENEKLGSEGFFTNEGKKTGIWKNYFADGTLNEEIDYNAASEIKTTIYDRNGKVVEVKKSPREWD